MYLQVRTHFAESIRMSTPTASRLTAPPPADGVRYRSLSEFYPFYLSEHQNPTSRRLHFIGTALLIVIAVYAIVTLQWVLLWLVPVVGYGFAWVGHAFFEKNKPATFQYPLFSLASDFLMFGDILRGRVKW